MAASLLPLAEAKRAKTDFDKSVDFTLYKTYAWSNGYPVPNPVTSLLLVAAVDAEMQTLGLRRLDDPDVADLLIRYDARVEHQTGGIAVDPMYTASGGMPTASAGFSNVWNQSSGVMSAAEGTIQLRLLDTAKQKIVWGSSMQEHIEQKSSKRLKQINKMITAMFADYPRGPKNAAVR
jgi:hypothetical protein